MPRPVCQLRHNAYDGSGLTGAADLSVPVGSGLRGTFEGVVRWDEVAGGIARLHVGQENASPPPRALRGGGTARTSPLQKQRSRR